MKKLSIAHLTSIFQKTLGKEVKLILNNNQYRLIKVIAVEGNKVQISIHRLFLYSSEYFIYFIANKVKKHPSFEETKISLLFEKKASTFPKEKLKVAGTHYHLGEIFQRVNEKYFQKKIDIPITWFGDPKRKARSFRTIGYYDLDCKVIKIHRLLDDPYFPPFYLDFIVYHEMLHHVYPPYFSKKGKYLMHHKTFKEMEKKFQKYCLAIEWEKKHLDAFFSN